VGYPPPPDYRPLISLLIILRKIAQAHRFGEILFEKCKLTRIASQVFFEMDSYVMILVKIVLFAYPTVV
jgi:hypothetical protein